MAKESNQPEIFQHLNNFVEAMALRSVVELGVADVLSNPMTLPEIAVRIALPSLDTGCLSRLMRFLSGKKIFGGTIDKESGEILYCHNESSKWLLTNCDSEVNFVSFLLLTTHPYALASWNHLTSSIAEGGGCGFSRANGSTLYDFQLKNSEYKKVFCDAMDCNSRLVMKAVLNYYKDEFKTVGSIVEVGGGSGATVAEIVKAHPYIKGFNFDLPCVVANAPEYPNVTHVGGDMFTSTIPQADAIFLKSILHNWSDEECLPILKNCKNALAERNGKLIIVDIVLHPQTDDSRSIVEALRYDLTMLVMTPNGKERTEDEWNKVLKAGGFSHYKIIKIPSLLSIIEAY